MSILKQLTEKEGQIALLIDPEKTNELSSLKGIIEKATFAGVSYFFVGGSTVKRSDIEKVVQILKSNSSIPVILFPGASHQLSESADALLFLSLISGRNPDYLIGHHVQCAEEVNEMALEVLPTAYLLVDGGKPSSVAYISQTTPIPRDQENIVLKTAIAGKLMGQQIIYLDAGSGALHHVPTQMVKRIKSKINLPLIVGGGVKDIQAMETLKSAGVNVIVIGNKIEEDIEFLLDIATFVNQQ